MAFFKLRNRGPQANEGRNTSAAAAPAESVEAMRRRARHRLVGAAVLVLAGVIGFPLLFDTQPRPVPVDIPIEIPDRNQAKPLPLPTPPTSAAPPAAGAAPTNRSSTPSSSGSMITERADGTEVPATPPAANQASSRSEPEPAPERKAEARPEPKPEPKPETKPETKPKSEAKSEPPEPKPDTRSADAKSPPAKPAADESGARARALLEGKTVAAAKAAAAAAAAKSQAAAAADDSGRFVVQVGAFAEADKAREVRQKLDKAGLKSYTQVLKTSEGERTRVRVGPFASRADADRAASRIKAMSLAASVLTL